jgi:hypothetical protein
MNPEPCSPAVRGVVRGHVGLHLYFPVAAEGDEQASLAIPRAHVDFRGLGGYVIAPPSQVEGCRYRLVATGRGLRPVDGRAVRGLLEPQPRRPRPRPGMAWDGRHSGGQLGVWLAGQAEGNRNRALFWAACRQAEAGISQDDARAVLGLAAARSGLGDREIDATLASAYRSAAHRSPEAAATPGLGR